MTLSTLLHKTVCENGQDHHGEMPRITVQHQLLMFAFSKPQSATPLLKDRNLGPGKSASQLHSEMVVSSTGRIMRCTKVLGK